MDAFKMKQVLVLVLISALILNVLSERIKLATQSEHYNFFPLKSNYLEVNVKADENVRIVLTNSSELKSPYYEVVLGSAGDTVSYLQRDNVRLRDRKGSVLGKSEYKKFWISLEPWRGIIKVGSSYNRPFLFYADLNYLPVKYFGITTNGKNPGHWDFGSDLILPCVEKVSVEKVVQEKCIKYEGHVYVPGEVIVPDVV